MFNAFDLKTTVVPDNANLLVTRLGRRTTIHHFPVEILTEILVHCIPLLVPTDCHLPSLKKCPSEIRETLSDVCRLWRTIIDREPRVWATLAFEPMSRPDPEVVSACLKKSKHYPLDVYIGIEYLAYDSRATKARDRRLVCTVNLSPTAYIFISPCDSFLPLQNLSTASSHGSAPFSRLNIS